MKNISRFLLTAVIGAFAAAALTGCSYTQIRDTVVDGYQNIQDGVVDGWNDMVDGFVADAPNYGIEVPASSSQNAQ